LLPCQIGLGLGVEKTHLDLAAVDATGGIGLVDRELDGTLDLVAELRIGACERGRDADLDRFLGRPGASRH